MDCNGARAHMGAYGDGEPGLVRHVDLEAHLRACPQCAGLARAVSARRDALRAALPRYAAPPQLRERIRAQLRPGGVPAGGGKARRAPVAWPVWRLSGIAASLALMLGLGYGWGEARARSAFLLDEAVSDHVRSLDAGHLLDVVSTDQHTVKPWFAGKLDFSPPVADLADAGFPLAGGRLERIGGHAAAALVFHHRLHSINLFVWLSAGAARLPRAGGERGYAAEGWTSGDLCFLAVSDIPAADLHRFTEAYRSRTGGAGAP